MSQRAEVETSLVLVEIPRAIDVPIAGYRVLAAAFRGGASTFGALTVLDEELDVADTVDLWDEHELYFPRYVAGTPSHAFVGAGSDIDSVVAAFTLDGLSLLSTVRLVEDAASGLGKMRLVGDVLWVPAGDGGDTGLFAVDVSNPASLAVIGSSVDPLLAGAEDVEVAGATAFVASYLAGMIGRVVAMNVTDPTDPTVVSSVEVRLPTGVALAGSVLFVTSAGDGANFGDQLVAVDVSDPAAMSVLSTLQDHTLLRNAYKVAVDGGYAYVTRNGGLTVVDVSNPAAMTVAGTLAGDMAGDVAKQGSLLYVGSGVTGGVTAVDVTDPASPSAAGSASGEPVAGATGVAVVVG